jgi:hypothetical protein
MEGQALAGGALEGEARLGVTTGEGSEAVARGVAVREGAGRGSHTGVPELAPWLQRQMGQSW